MFANIKTKNTISRKLKALLALFIFIVSIGQPMVEAAPWGLSAQLTNPSQSAVTTLTMNYEPHGTIADQSTITLDFDDNISLSSVNFPGDVLVTGNNVLSTVASADLIENKINIVLTGTADAANPLTFVINNVQNAPYQVAPVVRLFVYDNLGVETERDVTGYYIQGNTGILVAPLTHTPTSVSFEALPTTNMMNDWDLEVQFPYFMYLGDMTAPDVTVTGTNITGFTPDLSQTGSNIVRINLNVTGDTAGDPIQVTFNNAKSAKYEAGGNMYVTSYDDLDNTVEQGDPYLFVLADQFTTKTVALSSYQAGASNVDYSFSLEPRNAYFQQYDRFEIQFPGGTGMSNAQLVSTNPNYQFSNDCISCNPLTFTLSGDAGPSSGPVTFTVENVQNPFNVGNQTIIIRAYIDDNAQGLPDDGSYDGVGYIGTIDYSLSMQTSVHPDSIVASAQTAHRIYFRPDTDLEDDWQIFLEYNPEADLSNVTPGDITVFANTPTTVSNVVIDNMAKTILMDVAFYSDTSSGGQIAVNINNIINPASPGTYPVQVETRDNTLAHIVVDSGTGTYTIAAPFDVPVTVDSPYEQTQTTFHLTGFTPTVNIQDNWVMRIIFPDDVDITNVDSNDLTAETTSTNKISSLNNFQKDIANRYIQADIDITSGDSEGYAWNVDINDVITPTSAGTYILKVLYFEDKNFSYENEVSVSDSLFMQTEGEGDFLINAGSPPVFISADPANNDTGVGLAPLQTYVLDDANDGIDTATLDITSNGLDVYINGVCQTADFTCEPIENDPLGPDPNQITIRFRPNAQYPTFTSIPVTIYVEDNGGLSLTRNLQFDTGDVLQAPYSLYSNDDINGAQSGNSSPSTFTGTTPVFSAQYYNNNGVDLTHYEIQVSSDPTFADTSPTVMLVNSGKKSVDDVDAFANGALDHIAFDAFGGRLPDIQIDPTNPYVKSTPYYWRIRYWEESEHGDFPTSWADAEFMILDNPYLVSSTPANAAYNVNVATNQLTYVYDDDGDGMDTNGVYLYIEYFDTVNSIYHFDPLIENSVCNPTFTVSCSITDIGNGQIQIDAELVDPLLPSTTYYTYPTVQDLAANSVNDTLYFSTPYPPDAPQNLHANTATNGSATDFSSPATVPGTNVVFGSMHQSSFGAPADFYSIQVDNNSDFSSPECDTGKVTTGAPVANGDRLDDIVVPGCTFVDGQTYYWQMSYWNDTLQGPWNQAELTIAASVDTTPPAVNRTPANAATNVPRTQSFIVTITDADSDVDISTVNISIDGDSIVAGGVLDGDYSFTQNPGADAPSVTYEFTRNDPTQYTYGETVNFIVQASDTESNAVPVGQQTTTFTFENAPDTTAPTVNRTPANTATDVPRTQSFVVTINDGGSGVDISTVNISIAGHSAVTGGILNNADYTFTQSPSGDGASVTYEFTRNDPTQYVYGANVNFVVQAADVAGNPISGPNQTTSFTFENAPDTNAPTISTTPSNGATNIPKTQSFVVTVSDAESQVDISTVNITVGGSAVVTNGALNTAEYTFTQSPGGDAASVTYQFTRNDPTQFADGNATFEVNVRDTNNNLATANNSFTFASAAPVTTVSGGGGGGGGYTSTYESNENAGSSSNANTNTGVPAQNANVNAPTQPQQNTNSAPSEPERPTAPEENLATCEFFESQVADQKYTDINDAILNNYAAYLLDHGVILGRNSSEFGSNDSMTRSEVLRSIVQANCKKFSLQPVTRAPFPDVSVDHKDALYIDAAKRASIISGYGDGTYKPDRFISRAEAVKVVFQEVLGEQVAVFDGKVQPFKDIGESEWYVNYIRFGVEVGILKDNPAHTFLPHNAITREDITKLLVDTLRYREKLENVDRPAAPEFESETGVEKLDPNKMIRVEDTIKEPTPACSYFEVRRTNPKYTDLSGNKDMMDYAARLLTYGVVVGKDVENFAAMDEVTRSEILRIMIQANCKDYVLEPVLEKPFPDVPLMHKDAMFIQAAKRANIISGYGDGTFRPDNKINRAEILKILLEAALNKTFSRFDGALEVFTDVPRDAWFARYLRFASTQKILEGEGTQFKPDQNGNRGFIASTLLKILEFKDRLIRR